LFLVCGLLMCAAGEAQTVKESSLGEAVERQLPDDPAPTQWVRDPKQFQTEAGDRIEVRPVVDETLEIVKLTNVIQPIRFDSGVANIRDKDVELLRKALERLHDRRNVRLHLVGHADDQPLSDALVRVYSDNAGLSRERAGEVAEFLQRALMLAPDAISYEWAGDSHPVASNATAEGRALNRRVEVEVWYDQPKARVTEKEVLVRENFKQLKMCRVETQCKLRFKEGHARRARVKNLVAPLHYGEESTEVSPEFLEHVRQALDNLSDKRNVVVKFIGYSDNVPLTGRNERIYGDYLALSKARAHRVALAVKDALKLPSAGIASEGRGASQPLAPNETAQGRALNRRIEVQFWYDDPLQEMPDGLQLCPDVDAAEVVTKVYDPPWGTIAPLQLENGRAIIPPGYTENLRRAMADIGDKKHVRLRFIGYTANERLDRRTAAVYGDDIGLSAARARRAMETIREQMQLTSSQAEHEGRGYLQSSDVVNVGFTQGEDSYVVVQVVYDELAVLDDYEGVDITRMTRELTPKSPFGLNPMHITVDGKPLDDPDRSSADVQRCTDVALDKANIQFQFDNLKSRPRLSVVASPSVVLFQQLEDEGVVAQPVRFKMYANYAAFIDRAEVRIFEAGRSVQSEPLDVVAVDADGFAEWQPAMAQVAGSQRELKYVLRAYGENGNFDDTEPQSLWMLQDQGDLQVRPKSVPHKRREAAPDSPSSVLTTDIGTTTNFEIPLVTPAVQLPGDLIIESNPFGTTTDFSQIGVTTNFETESEGPAPAQAHWALKGEPDLLAGYGENALAIQNIQLGSGTVTVRGSGVPAGHSVWVAGHPVPVDAKGNFIAEEILPTGTHTVEVALLDQEGNGTLYLRDLQFQRKDQFFVGMADITASKSKTSGPAQLLQGTNAPYDYDSSLDGRLAFYGTEKFGDHWRVTASADTREEPLKDLFSNFLNKSPDSLFRRIDPDYHYPTFGDDSIVEEMAPTLGKFYFRLDHNDDHALWGNFKVNYADNELARIDRGLYGANAHWQSDATTDFGERRIVLDGFAAEPGTVASREEFRGTGGSLYYLRHQDILTGSERVRIELRDKDSGLVMGVVELQPSDYDIDYLQGRILLAEPLSATATDDLLVRSQALSGEVAYLVVRYEYAPGLDEINALVTGGQGHYWLNDHIRLGLTGSSSDEGDSNSGLRGADLTLRKSADSWFKVQGARSQGLVSSASYSDDGGFGFRSDDTAAFSDTSADGYRADLSVGFGDFLAKGRGRLTLYTQNLDAGYSAPGYSTLTQREYYGGTFRLPFGERLNVNAKADRKVQDMGLETTAEEVDIAYKLTGKWSVSTGVRKDERKDNSPVIPLTQEQGERTDAVMQVGFDSLKAWRAYGFVQDTVSKTENREDNGRVGAGGSYRFNNRLRVEAEVSDGDLGTGGKLGTNYLVSDRTSLYLNYALENERMDNGLEQRRGNLISGMKRRLSDSSSVYVEERYQDTDQMSGLTHATGVNLTTKDHWNIGANTEIGTLADSQTGAKTKRTAGGIRVGYAFEKVQISSGVEYRHDDTEQPDTTMADRTTWLFRNNFKYQMTPDWRIVGKFNHSLSDSSQGQFYDGGYTEAVIGYGYRPVSNDRLNALAKYTYFYNVPATDQITLQNTAAQYIQKSHVASLDVTYDLTAHWSVGGKYAYRLGQLSLDRVNPQFFDNRAQLYILRADWHFRQHWEGLIEGRVLDMPDLNERRGGVLLGLYRYLGEHVKAGLGYNFTSFSEDLTDLSFRHHGVFVNVVGAM
jgi:flagellar motor protein MotB